MLLSRPLSGCLLYLALLSMFLMVSCAGDSDGGNDDELATNESDAGDDLATELPPNPSQGGPSPIRSPTPVRGTANDPVTTEDVEGRVFTFDDGAAFNLPGEEVTLVFDNDGTILDVLLVAGLESLTGQFFVDENEDDGRNGECRITIDTVSAMGLNPGPVFRFDQCEIDAHDRLVLRNEVTGRQSVSNFERVPDETPSITPPSP